MGAVLKAIVSHSTVSQGTLFMHRATYAADICTLHTSRERHWEVVHACSCVHMKVCIVRMLAFIYWPVCFIFTRVSPLCAQAPAMITAHRCFSNLILWSSPLNVSAPHWPCSLPSHCFTLHCENLFPPHTHTNTSAYVCRCTTCGHLLRVWFLCMCESLPVRHAEGRALFFCSHLFISAFSQRETSLCQMSC